jgi:hypothetical protein
MGAQIGRYDRLRTVVRQRNLSFSNCKRLRKASRQETPSEQLVGKSVFRPQRTCIELTVQIDAAGGRN